jgi:hypothetical protein
LPRRWRAELRSVFMSSSACGPSAAAYLSHLTPTRKEFAASSSMYLTNAGPLPARQRTRTLSCSERAGFSPSKAMPRPPSDWSASRPLRSS